MKADEIRAALAKDPDTGFVLRLGRLGRGGIELRTKIKSVTGREAMTTRGTFDVRSFRLVDQPFPRRR